MQCPFTSLKIFCVGPNFLSQPKNLTAFSASSKPFVPAQKANLLNANHLFVWHKMFVTATISKQIFGLTQKIWTSPKHFGTCKRTRQKSDLANLLNNYGSFCDHSNLGFIQISFNRDLSTRQKIYRWCAMPLLKTFSLSHRLWWFEWGRLGR